MKGFKFESLTPTDVEYLDKLGTEVKVVDLAAAAEAMGVEDEDIQECGRKLNTIMKYLIPMDTWTFDKKKQTESDEWQDMIRQLNPKGISYIFDANVVNYTTEKGKKKAVETGAALATGLSGNRFKSADIGILDNVRYVVMGRNKKDKEKLMLASLTYNQKQEKGKRFGFNFFKTTTTGILGVHALTKVDSAATRIALLEAELKRLKKEGATSDYNLNNVTTIEQVKDEKPILEQDQELLDIMYEKKTLEEKNAIKAKAEKERIEQKNKKKKKPKPEPEPEVEPEPEIEPEPEVEPNKEEETIIDDKNTNKEEEVVNEDTKSNEQEEEETVVNEGTSNSNEDTPLFFNRKNYTNLSEISEKEEAKVIAAICNCCKDGMTVEAMKVVLSAVDDNFDNDEGILAEDETLEGIAFDVVVDLLAPGKTEEEVAAITIKHLTGDVLERNEE